MKPSLLKMYPKYYEDFCTTQYKIRKFILFITTVCVLFLIILIIVLAPVVQRPDNFIRWISHYPTVSICAKISVFPRVQANMHTLTTAKFGSVRKPWTTFNVKYILDPE